MAVLNTIAERFVFEGVSYITYIYRRRNTRNIHRGWTYWTESLPAITIFWQCLYLHLPGDGVLFLYSFVQKGHFERVLLVHDVNSLDKPSTYYICIPFIYYLNVFCISSRSFSGEKKIIVAFLLKRVRKRTLCDRSRSQMFDRTVKLNHHRKSLIISITLILNQVILVKLETAERTKCWVLFATFLPMQKKNI